MTAPVLSDGAATYTPGVSEVRGGVSTFVTGGLKNQDAQWSSAGALMATRTYDAFGNLVGSSGSWQGPFGYGGAYGYQEDASGLKLLGHRYYDPSTGSFLSRDPIKDGRNWYAYCAGDPVKHTDPTGLAIYDDPDDPIYNTLVGLGDGVTFGLTKIIRAKMDTDDMVNEDNGYHFAGELAGQVIGTYLVGAGAGKAFTAVRGVGRPAALRLGGAGTEASHLVRIEAGPVHLYPGMKASAVNVLHFHLEFWGLGKLHLPYQLWRQYVAVRVALRVAPRTDTP